MTPDPEPSGPALDDLLDRLVAEYADAAAAGAPRDPAPLLARAPARARPGLERCFRMIDAAGAGERASPSPLVPGARLDQYELVRELGRGGMAVVWLARDEALRRPVALKLLRPGLAFEGRHVDRFRREALAMARVDHAHVVGVHGVGHALGHAYIALEYVAGPSLATVLAALPRDRPLRPDDLARAAGAPALARDVERFEQALARLFARIAHALSAAHAQGLVHRDVKPSNVLLRPDGSPVVCDFGLAKGGEDPALSLTGEPLGTPYYMSPEQAVLSGHKIDHRTDVYSLGVMLYEACAGRRPFDGANALEVLEAIKRELPPALRAVAPDASREAEAVVRRAMARLPEERYADMRAFAADLEALAAGLPTAARRAEGGALRRAWSQVRLATSGQVYEYRSPRRLLGLPLVHVIGGPRAPGAPARVARGWVALGGERAVGGFACSREAYGVVATGAVAVGGFAWGGAALGGFVFAGLGLGLFTFCGISLAFVACGGLAFGYGAIGGFGVGRYVVAGHARGTYEWTDRRHDPEVPEFFEGLVPFGLERLWDGTMG